MDSPVVRIPANMTVKGARQIAALKRTNHFLISEGTRVLGLVCCDDLALAGERELVWAWTRRPITGVSPDTDAGTALELMDRGRVSFLPVTAGAMVLGIVTQDRLRAALSRVGKRRDESAAVAD